MSIVRGRRGSRRGANAIEFALTVPVLVLITLGIMDYGWLYAVMQEAQAAAQDGARAGAQIDLEDEELDPVAVAEERATTRIGESFPASGMAPEIDAALIGGDTRIRVSVTVSFEPLVGFVPVPTSYVATAERYLESI